MQQDCSDFEDSTALDLLNLERHALQRRISDLEGQLASALRLIEQFGRHLDDALEVSRQLSTAVVNHSKLSRAIETPVGNRTVLRLIDPIGFETSGDEPEADAGCDRRCCRTAS
jgi:hypothetical protein